MLGRKPKRTEVCMIRVLDLGSGVLSQYPLPPEMMVSFLGGLGLAVRLMADWPATVRPDKKPIDLQRPSLDNEIPLIIAVGSLNGTRFPGANRACFFGVSPLTDIFAGSWLGGDFSSGFVKSRTTALVLEGRATAPSIIVLREDGVELIPREDLWGKTVSGCRAVLSLEYPSMSMAAIGPAGEKLVNISCIRGNEGHAAGRCGLGAVLGSKNIKAIVAGGNNRPKIADPDGLKVINRETMKAIRQSEFLKDVQGPIGTASLTKMVNEFEALPTANFRQRFYAPAASLYGELINEQYVVKRTTCPTCPVRCRAHVEVDGQLMEAPEYETICLFGSNNQIDDYPLIAKANTLCNDLGLDTISAGNVIAFYREYADKLDDPGIILDLIDDIAFRKKVGEILSNGVRSSADTLGGGFAMHVKGLELAGYDPRKLTGMAISYSTANRGGCHSRSWTVADEVGNPEMSARELAELVARYHDLGCVKDSMITCTFLDGDIRAFYPSAISAVLGTEIEEDQLRMTGERIYTLERMLNIQRGVSAVDDVLPKRLQSELVSPSKYAEGMEIYYELRDWDTDGKPRNRRVKELNLGFMLER
jgi:aldehyde:ferredoxin oxidoreductase